MSDSSVLADPPERLRPFVRDGRIAALPVKRSRRRLLLEQVAQAFEPGLRYPEREVDEILKPLFDDHCTLRRYLIDEDLLSRTPGGGPYWRSGGPVSFYGAGEADVARGAGGADAVGGAQGASDA
ncbi:MAG TPA: DUF2087 domain-containing protein [Streptosporangiaceae bacterium]|nr:DUF2087 domain-containing protein [Streptosporangiaceae bacterium]